MTLQVVAPGRYRLVGVINFDTAPAIEQQGRSLLLASQGKSEDWAISMAEVLQADSASLSVCLSWLRLAREQHKTIHFVHLSRELEALAKVCGIRHFLIGSAPGRERSNIND